MTRWFCTVALAPALLLAACAATVPGTDPLSGADVILLGEQHDDPAHHLQHRETVQSLAARGSLAAVALEMAEQGRSTAGLARSADEATVRAALNWSEEAWPWKAYGPAVMAAVGAGVPVLGANLPRDQMRSAMRDPALDTAVGADVLAAQREAVRKGHCDLLPAQQLGPMVRVQVARDRAMARTVAGSLATGKAVVLITGAAHADPAVGVPLHLPAGLSVRPVLLPRSAAAPVKDYCEELRRQLPARPAAS